MRSFYASCVCVCVLTCVWEREREGQSSVSCVYMLSCEREGDTVTQPACVQTITNFITVSVTRQFPSRAWIDAKTKDIINCLYIYFKS